MNGADQSATGSDHFAASQVEFEMEPQRNTIKTMTASGDVRVASQDANGTRSMKTNALLVNFVPVDGAGGNRNESSTGPARQRIESAETLSPATIEMKNGGETTTLRAKQFVTRFDARGHLDQLLGHSGVEIVRQTGSAAPQTTTSPNSRLRSMMRANGPHSINQVTFGFNKATGKRRQRVREWSAQPT